MIQAWESTIEVLGGAIATVAPPGASLVSDGRYDVRLASSACEVASALRLRFEVFKVELVSGTTNGAPGGLEVDEYDRRCRHLIVIERSTNRTVGTYRLNSVASADEMSGVYSFSEFTIEDLPAEILEQGLEIGRACIAADHRNTKVLFLLWKGLANHLVAEGKRYFFGCCSIFTRDALVGERAFRQLAEAGHFHERYRVEPRRNALYYGAPADVENATVALPSLFEMYLRIGAKVCGPPMIDDGFGTIDFFVMFDLERINGKYKRMFLG